ncbi:MAG TPA: hypothetical protein DEB21_05700, partial [Rhodospirillaceae bacterium]|nr:hypothetical protein [Rhodospirillaceae bacterium]
MSATRRRLESHATSVEWGEFKGRRTGAAANAPLLLDRAGGCVLVLSGHVDVFAVRVENGEPVGQRHPLFRANTGEAVFAPDDAAPFKFLVVGVDETEIMHEMPDDDWARFTPDHLAAMIDRFIGGLSGSL